MHISLKTERVIFMLYITVFALYFGISTCFWRVPLNGTEAESLEYSSQPVPFEPEVLEDFPTVISDSPRIPHIMHFIFITGLQRKENIPSIYFYNVKKFSFFNPDWTIYFWGDISARQLISSKYPSLLPTWDNYTRPIYKADALRYVVLHEFGGVYSDLDTRFVRSLDRATMKYACIISPEPFEHSTILYQRPFQLNNGFLLCRKGHPFMKQVFSSLPQSAQEVDILEVAGPRFLTKQFIFYNKLTPGDLVRNKADTDSNSPYFYKGALKEDDFDAVYVPNTRYFMNNLDWTAPFGQRCREFSFLNSLVKRGCQILKERGLERDLNPFSFIDHRWNHMYSVANFTEMIPVDSVIPKPQLRIWRIEYDGINA